VLTIFIRVNSAGTVLSYSDLLLSIATAQWTTLDAREEIQRLVDDINRVGSGFTFTKDFVLKTCLMLGGFETRFATDNFKSENMQRIEAMWAKIAAATRTTARLLAEFGFSGETLPSTNAVIPIVHYVYLRGNPDGLVESSSYKADRDHIRRWLNIALLKRVFTGQPDSILRAVRDALDGNSSDGFPSEAIVDALRSKPRSMRFEGEEVDKIIDEKYGSGYTFATLALLYPWLDFRNHFHQDHIHPKSHFTRAQLARRGVTDSAAVADYSERYDRIPNLQLLQGVPNQEKSNKPFVDWLKEQYPLEDERRAYMRQHDIPDVDPSMGNFLNFYEARRELMATRLREIVGLNGSERRRVGCGCRSPAPDTSDVEYPARDAVVVISVQNYEHVHLRDLRREVDVCSLPSTGFADRGRVGHFGEGRPVAGGTHPRSWRVWTWPERPAPR
jgi:hypothetical protein